MRKSRIALAGVGVAAAAITGTAFTNSNTVPTTSIAGYGASTVSGISVSNIEYVPDATDHANLARVVFTTADSLTGKNSSMSLRGAGGILATVNCTNAVGTITCVAPANTTIQSVLTVGLTVVQGAPTP